SSAFGAKAGDAFTRFTIYVVAVWIVTCIAASLWARNRVDALGKDILPPVTSTVPVEGTTDAQDADAAADGATTDGDATGSATATDASAAEAEATETGPAKTEAAESPGADDE
ncbi:MAG: hypothetical protein AAF596_05955, partial [Planctomycetota bacterium]